MTLEEFIFVNDGYTSVIRRKSVSLEKGKYKSIINHQPVIAIVFNQIEHL